MLYSIIESCKLVGLNPKDYLRVAAETALTTEKRHALPHELVDAAA